MFYDVILASLVIHLYKQIILIFFFLFLLKNSLSFKQDSVLLQFELGCICGYL